MKRLVLIVVLFASALSLSAQRSVQVWEGNMYSTFPIETVDSITFLLHPKGTLRECKTDTVFITKTDTVERVVTKHDTVTVVKTDTVYINQCEDSNKAIGVFSVSADKQVAFAQGNLQYTQSTKTWSFAKHQYDTIGAANMNGNVLADKIDLFGWSANNTTAPFGINLSNKTADYLGDFVDWGINEIGNDAPNTWRTLTRDEWNYLIHTRANAKNLMGVVQITTDSSTYVNGFIFLPDAWVCPAGVTFKSGFATKNDEQAYADHQTIVFADWQKMEAAGAVFLPCAGSRNGSTVYLVGYYGIYWSATADGDDSSALLSFDPEGIGTGSYCGRFAGRSVRLVQDLK